MAHSPHTIFTVTPAGRESTEPFSNYMFDVSHNGRKVAEISHDYRRDGHWIRASGGRWKLFREQVMEGGGPVPFTLTEAGIRIVQLLIAE